MDIHEWIHPEYLDVKKIVQLRKSLQVQSHVRIIVLENFLIAGKAAQLHQELISCNKEYLRKEVYADGTLDIDFYSYQGGIIDEVKAFFRSDIFLRYLSLFFGNIPILAYTDEVLNSYTHGGTLIQTFSDTNYLNWHDDRDDDAMMLYYLNHDWNPDKGGYLELGYKNQAGDYVCYDKISPSFNTLALLMPKIGTYHRVSPVASGYIRKGIVEHLSFQQ